MKTYRVQQDNQKYRNLPSQRPKGDEENSDKLVRKLFFANNISFAAADSPEFGQLCTALRPGYSSPPRRRLGNEMFRDMGTEDHEWLQFV